MADLNELNIKRRKILADGNRQIKEAGCTNLSKISEINKNINKEYEKLLTELKLIHEAKANDTVRLHKGLLDNRLNDLKRQLTELEINPSLLPRYVFLKDYLAASNCQCEPPVIDLSDPAKATTASDCLLAENKVKPFVSLSGEGDDIPDRCDLTCAIGFNLPDQDFPANANYKLKPAIFLSGYWLKENWNNCEGTMPSSGYIEISLRITATQLGGTKVLADTTKQVFKWENGNSYTGTIDSVYNVTDDASSQVFTVVSKINPVDGDVYVKISLTIKTNMTGYGRYLVDMKNSSNFYFWVERLELLKQQVAPCYLVSGINCKLPSAVISCKNLSISSFCTKIGSPNLGIVCKKIGSPILAPVCFIGGPDSGGHCPGPIIDCNNGPLVNCKNGPIVDGCAVGPATGGCNAGPMYVPPDESIYIDDFRNIPQGMRKNIVKMVDKMLDTDN